MRAASKLTTDTALSDADLLRNVRDLFKLTLDDVVTSGISRRTWTRIEANEEHKHTPGVKKRLAALQDIMQIVGRWPYAYARRWAVTPLHGGGKAPRDLVRTVIGMGYLRSLLRSAGEQMAT
jgi:uncharacterized protein (DUF2384 family)